MADFVKLVQKQLTSRKHGGWGVSRRAPWHIPASPLRKAQKLRRGRRRRKKKAGLLAEQLPAGDGARAPGREGAGGQQSWKGAARSRHPSASGPHPPGGPGEGGQRKGAERDREDTMTLCLPAGRSRPSGPSASVLTVHEGLAFWPLFLMSSCSS